MGQHISEISGQSSFLTLLQAQFYAKGVVATAHGAVVKGGAQVPKLDIKLRHEVFPAVVE